MCHIGLDQLHPRQQPTRVPADVEDTTIEGSQNPTTAVRVLGDQAMNMSKCLQLPTAAIASRTHTILERVTTPLSIMRMLPRLHLLNLSRGTSPTTYSRVPTAAAEVDGTTVVVGETDTMAEDTMEPTRLGTSSHASLPTKRTDIRKLQSLQP